MHRTCEDGINATISHPATKGTVDACVVDFGSPIAARLNRQRLPLAPQVELQQDVVEDLVQRQLDVRTPASTREVRQDKFIKLLKTQTRWNALPVLALRLFARQSRRILPDMVGLAQTQCSCGLADNSNFRKTRNQLPGNFEGLGLHPHDPQGADGLPRWITRVRSGPVLQPCRLITSPIQQLFSVRTH